MLKRAAFLSQTDILDDAETTENDISNYQRLSRNVSNNDSVSLTGSALSRNNSNNLTSNINKSNLQSKNTEPVPHLSKALSSHAINGQVN